MAIYTGFSTIEVNQPQSAGLGKPGGLGPQSRPQQSGKKFKLTDHQLVVRDLLNSLSIKQGDKVGNPSYGSTIWSYVFEANTPDTRQEMDTEIRRLISLDPRIVLNNLAINSSDNGVMFEMEVAFAPFNQATTIVLNLDKNSGTASQVA